MPDESNTDIRSASLDLRISSGDDDLLAGIGFFILSGSDGNGEAAFEYRINVTISPVACSEGRDCTVRIPSVAASDC